MHTRRRMSQRAHPGSGRDVNAIIGSARYFTFIYQKSLLAAESAQPAADFKPPQCEFMLKTAKHTTHVGSKCVLRASPRVQVQEHTQDTHHEKII